jgi:hypothetical protein
MKKLLFLFAAVLLLAFTGDTGRAVYEVPLAIQSIASTDLDLDGDVDIITGHSSAQPSGWGGMAILRNEELGYFQLKDSVFLNNNQFTILADHLVPNGYPSIIARHYEDETPITAVITNSINGFDVDYYPMQYGIYDFTTGKANADTLPDLVFISNENSFLGTMINDGTGKFNNPEYYNIIDFEPLTINCADFDNNGLDDVVLTGVYAEVYFNYGDHFEKLELENGTGRTNTHIVDFDGDDDFDIVAYTCFWGYSFVSVQENIDGQSFELREVLNFEELTNEFAASDFNNDGLPDAAFHLMDNSGLIVYFNQGDFVLDKPVVIDSETGDGAGCDMVCDDFDNNGYNDISFTQNLIISTSSTYISTVNILFNDGDGGFIEDPITTIPETNYSKSSPYQLTCNPNPVRDQATFSFNLPENVHAEIRITDLQGNHISVLNPSQNGKATWNVRDENVKPGLYIGSLIVNGKLAESVKIVVIRD